MLTQKEIRRRIAAVRSTQKITRAMKLVAAARFRGAQQRAVAQREHASALYNMTVRVSRRLGRGAPTLWRRPPSINCVDILVISSDRGLCGGFNEDLLRETEDGIIEHEMHNIPVRNFVIGKKGAEWLRHRGYDVEEISSAGGREVMIGRLIDLFAMRYASCQSAGCNIAFNRFVSAARQKPTFWNLLPLSYRGYSQEHRIEYLYEPGGQAALSTLAAQLLASTLRQALMESEASEHAARMKAMDAATRNADEMIAHLTSVYNKVRQESITSELLDVVGGAEALRSTERS